MFDSAAVEPSPGPGDRAPGDTLDELFDAVPDDELDTELQRLLGDDAGGAGLGRRHPAAHLRQLRSVGVPGVGAGHRHRGHRPGSTTPR